LEREPQPEEQERAQFTWFAPELLAVVVKAWPASMTTVELERLAIPPPIYPPAPQPERVMHTERTTNRIKIEWGNSSLANHEKRY
jgi:hypothetical protein